MSAAGWGVSGLVVYLLILVVVAEVAKRARRDASPSDHFLAGRSLGTFVLFLTLYATAYSGNSPRAAAAPACRAPCLRDTG
jgi:Na+/proline symporter